MSKRQTYGVPYRGSKNRIAEGIIALLPTGKRFVDLFAGGCAMTHCALQSGKWESILSNDLYPLRGQTLFRRAVEGEYLKEDYYRIVSKEEFNDKRYVEPHIIAVWGWNGRGYLGQNWYDDVVVKQGITDLRHLPKGTFDPTPRLLRLQRLSGLDLSKVEFSHMNYTDYEHEEGDVVYCDPPYANLPNGTYDGKGFDTDAFWGWARTRDYPVYVSEYKAPDDFVSIWSKKRGGVQNWRDCVKTTTHVEHLFLHNRWMSA